MIKIEITDPFRESPEVLIRVAKFLMQCAGHDMVKAPEEIAKEAFEQRMKAAEQAIVDNFNNASHEEIFTGEPEPGSSITIAPYQHCGESDLSTNVGDLSISKSEFLENFTPIEDGVYPEPKGPILSFEDSLIKDAADNAARNMIESKKPKPRKKSSGAISTPPAPIPPVEELTPPTMVNGNTLIDKILQATNAGKITHTDVTQIVRKHGLEATKDIFKNDHLIPAINNDVDEFLRGK